MLFFRLREIELFTIHRFFGTKNTRRYKTPKRAFLGFPVVHFKLNTKIIINLALLLMTGMVLIGFVMIVSQERMMIRSEVEHAAFTLSLLSQSLFGDEDPALRETAERLANNTVVFGGFTCILAVGNDLSLRFQTPCPAVESALRFRLRRALKTQTATRAFTGFTWAIFWKRARYLVMAVPVHRNNRPAGAVGVACDLNPLYARLRTANKVLIVYIIVNTIILSLIGLYRFSRLTVRPLHRLLKRAEEYNDDDVFFFGGTEENEFNHLSKALNRMFSRISEGKRELKHTVESLEKANEELVKAQKDVIRAEKLASVGRLSAGIAHEIGNPIAIVVGYLDLLKQTDIDEKDRREYIRRAEDEINRINAIIRQLLDYSRQSDEAKTAVSVNQIIQELIPVVQFQPVMSNITIDLSLNAEFDKVLADSNQLRQVFLNLIMNAADAVEAQQNDEPGFIKITSETTPSPEGDGGGMLKLQCIDNGIGIPESEIGDIFDLFYTTKEPGKGTGLGLSVSFMLIETFGGRIEAESKPGAGTTISVILPLLRH